MLLWEHPGPAQDKMESCGGVVKSHVGVVAVASMIMNWLQARGAIEFDCTSPQTSAGACSCEATSARAHAGWHRYFHLVADKGARQGNRYRRGSEYACLAKVRLNFRLGRQDSGPYSGNYPGFEYGCPSGAACGGSEGAALFEIRVVPRIRSGIPAAKPEVQTDLGRAYSGPHLQ